MLGFINKFPVQKWRSISTTVYQFSQTPPGIWRATLDAPPPPYEGHSKTRSCPEKGYKDDYIPALKSYEERLVSLNLFSLEKRRLRDKLTECLKILTSFTNVDANKLFPIDNLSRTRSNGIKLRWKQVQLWQHWFLSTNNVAREWNKLPPLVVQCDTINSFKNNLDHHSINQDIR